MSRSLVKNAQTAFADGLETLSSSIDSDSSVFDMAGFQNAVFIAEITDSVATGVATLTVETNTSNATGGTAVTGASAAVTCAVTDDLNGTLLIVEVENVLERYIYANRASATANIAYGPVICILHNGVGRARKGPISQHSTVSTADVQVDA